MAHAEDKMSAALTKDIEKSVLNIVTYLREVSGFHTVVTCLELYFKIDDHSRLWLVYCTKVRLRKNSRDPLPRFPYPMIDLEREPQTEFKFACYNKDVTKADNQRHMSIFTKNESLFKTNSDQQNCTVCLSRTF